MKKNCTRFKVGERVKVVGRRSGHGSKVGDIVTITYSAGSGSYNAMTDNGMQYAYTPADLQRLAYTKEEIEKETEELEQQIKDNKMKIKFMKEHGLKEYDEEEFKIYAILETVEGSGSKIEKAKAIKALIGG